MTFGTVLIVVLIGYALYYGGLVIHDLFFDKRGVVEVAAIEEEEIDISDEAENFQPIEVRKDEPNSVTSQDGNEEEDDMPSMNGGIAIDDLSAAAEELVLHGEKSSLGQLCGAWSLSR